MNTNTDIFNSRVFKWANMQNVNKWNSRIKTFFTELEVDHLNYIEHTTNQPPAVMEYMNTILGDYYEQFWWKALQRQEV